MYSGSAIRFFNLRIADVLFSGCIDIQPNAVDLIAYNIRP